mmetsp:Transcript_37490/g.67511  ORF Transcript_37490/g.67511 Transcript_37490/m.67511 type:complete len:100 (+) Transcript_37490:1519-1818(+)
MVAVVGWIADGCGHCYDDTVCFAFDMNIVQAFFDREFTLLQIRISPINLRVRLSPVSIKSLLATSTQQTQTACVYVGVEPCNRARSSTAFPCDPNNEKI